MNGCISKRCDKGQAKAHPKSRERLMLSGQGRRNVGGEGRCLLFVLGVGERKAMKGEKRSK